MASLIATIAGAVVMGGVVGLIPYFVGKKRGLESMGQVCLILCILGNFIAGLYLSIPICLISLAVLLIKKGVNADSAQKAAGPQIPQHAPTQENPMLSQESRDSQAGMQYQASRDSQAGMHLQESRDSQAGMQYQEAGNSQAGMHSQASRDSQAGMQPQVSRNSQAGVQYQASRDSQAGMQPQGGGYSQTGSMQSHSAAGGGGQSLFCAYCGTRNDDGSAYCINCGRRMD